MKNMPCVALGDFLQLEALQDVTLPKFWAKTYSLVFFLSILSLFADFVFWVR